MRLFLLAAMLLSASPATAQEVNTATPGEAPPSATLEQLSWVIGRWEGAGIDGQPAIENWLPATGNQMIGTFVQTDASGEIMFSEHMALMEEGGSLVLRLKHFGPDLVGWEAQDEMEAFPLIAIEPCHAWFAGLTMRCDGPGGYLVAVVVRQVDGSAGELVFRFARASN